MVDLLIIHLPKFETNVVPGAPAILKGIANHCGLVSRTLDLNLDWVDACYDHGFDRRTCLTGISVNNIPKHDVKVVADNCIDSWANKIREADPCVVVLSVFSYYGQYFCHMLAKKLSGMTVVIGGPGVRGSLHEEPEFGEFMKSQGYAEYVLGDAEKTWIGYLSGKFNLGIPSQDVFLDPTYLPDYSDYEVERYRQNVQKFDDNYITDRLVVLVSGSKGCVRACDFCEIHRFWKYQQRSAEHIATEVLSALQVFGDCHIEFTDSLVNGNPRVFEQLLDQLIKIREEYTTLTWASQGIVRSPVSCPESLYQKMAASGMSCLHIGVETGSDRLRAIMQKNFTNDDLDVMLSMLSKYNMQCTILQFIGHPEETAEDFTATLKMYERYQKYATSTIRVVQLNFLMAVHKNTPLYDKADELGLKLTADPTLWYSTANPTLTVEERVRRRFLLAEHLDKLGYVRATDDGVQMQEMAIGYSKYKHAIKLINRTD